MRRFPEVTPQYDNVFLFEVRGDVDIDLLAAAVDDLVERHAVLRTTIAPSCAGHVQSVLDTRRNVLTELPGAPDVTAAGKVLLDRRPGTTEVLDGSPLFHAWVWPADPGMLLAVSLHHLISDEWSTAILWRDLAECYAARRARRPPSLPELATTYADYARWQRTTWPSLSTATVAFWRKMLDGCPGGIRWPDSRPVAKPSSTEVKFTPCFFPAKHYPSIRAFSRSCRVTPFLVLLSATAVATARVTGHTDLLFATDTAGRDSPATRDVMGFFVNTRLTRVNVAAARSFADVVAAVRATWFAAEEHRDCHIQPVREKLGEPAAGRVDAAMRVDMVHGLLDERSAPSLAGADLRSVPIVETFHYWRDLGLQWHPRADGYRADVIHKPSRIDPATLAALIDEIAAVLADPRV